MKILRNTLTGLALMVAVPLSHSGAAAGGATEWTQIANNLQLLRQSLTEIENLRNNIRKYQLMLRDYERLPDRWERNARGDLERLAELVTQGRSLSYGGASADAQYREAYGEYETRFARSSERSDETLEDQYRSWSQTNHDTVRAALRTANLQADQFYDEEASVRAIDRQMSSAPGQLQAMQAAGRIAQLQIEQMQKLRQLVSTQVRLQGADLASSTAERDSDEAALARIRKYAEFTGNRATPLEYDDILR